MSNGIKTTVAFIFGAAVGAGVAWKIVTTKYESIMQEEIDSVKEAFARKYEKEAEVIEDDPAIVKEELEEIASIYKTESTNIKKEGGSESMNNKIKIVDPDEFGEDEDYDVISLTCFEDGVVTDDQLDIIEDVDDLLGCNPLEHFGEYEDDSVFVKNDKLRCYYEVLRDYREYSDLNPPVDE